MTYNLLLEKYLQQQNTPDQGRLFGLSFRGISSLNCWRGYQAVYRVENDSLFLSAILGFGEKWSGKIDQQASADRMQNIFGDKVKKGLVFIDWFSGDISYPLNYKELRWDGVFYKIFEREHVFSVWSGKITKQEAVENYLDDPGRINRRDKKELRAFIIANLEKATWKNPDRCDCSDTYVITINKNGDISKVRLNYKPDEIKEYYTRRGNKFCTSTVFMAVRHLHFDILRDKGKPTSENIYVRISVSAEGKVEEWAP